jgi:WhiB family transcriptional regulator, redox-sensing transcriptional regulator
VSWRDRAKCLGEDTELFFPLTAPLPSGDALRLCAVCPVTAECDAWAEGHGERWGVWGGKDREFSRRRRSGSGERGAA